MSASAIDHPALNAHVAPVGSPVATALMMAGSTLAVWETRARTRGDLRRLDVARYADLGLTPAEILREVAKPFWRA